MAAGGVSFRFPSEPPGAFEAVGGATRVAQLRSAILERRPAAREALHGAAGLAAAGWKLLLTDAATKTGARSWLRGPSCRMSCARKKR